MKLFSIIHRIKKKYNYPIYAGGIETSTLLKDCNISRSTLFRSIKQLQENNLIKCEKIRTESSAISSNRFDKIINYTQMLVPKELEHILLSSTPVSKFSTTEKLPKNNINNDTNEVAFELAFQDKTTMSKKDPVCVKIIPSNMIKRNINIKELDKEKIDKTV
jgi:predicted transcriptional regulator